MEAEDEEAIDFKKKWLKVCFMLKEEDCTYKPNEEQNRPFIATDILLS